MFNGGTLDILTLVIYTHLSAMYGLSETETALRSRAHEVASAMLAAEDFEAFDQAYEESG